MRQAQVPFEGIVDGGLRLEEVTHRKAEGRDEFDQQERLKFAPRTSSPLNRADAPDFLSDHTDFQAMPKIPLKKNWYRLTSS